MALNKTKLKSDLKAIFEKSNSAEDAAKAISDAIDAYVKTATVTTQVSGTSATGGAVTGVGTGSLS